MTVQPTRDQLLDMTERLGFLGDRPELCDEVVDGLWAALDRAEHRIARLEAQTDIRGRAVVMYRERAREAEARIKAVQHLIDQADEMGEWAITCTRLQWAVDGSNPQPSA